MTPWLLNELYLKLSAEIFMEKNVQTKKMEKIFFIFFNYSANYQLQQKKMLNQIEFESLGLAIQALDY